MTLSRNRVNYLLVLAVLCAHTLRNVSMPGYFALYLAAALWSFVAFWRSEWRARLIDRGAVIVTWLGIVASGALMTFALSGASAMVNGLVKFLFAVPLFFALVAWTDDAREFRAHLLATVTAFTVLCMTLPMQFVTGPVPFFAQASSRGGEVRFASAVGSLTSIGIIVGCYIILAQLARPWLRWTLLLLISFATVVSLSKAAMANVVLGWLVILWLNRRNRKMLVATLVGIPSLALAAYALVPAVADRINTSLLAFGVQTSKSQQLDDVSFAYSILDRLTMLPANNWAALADLGSPLVYATGGGFGMGDTALVGEGQGLTIMAHNQVFESLSVFGLIGGLVQWGLIVLVGILLMKRASRDTSGLFGILALTWGMFVVNSVLANGTLYQPLSGAVLYLLMFGALSERLAPHHAVATGGSARR